jgi:hypothetical protein
MRYRSLILGAALGGLVSMGSPVTADARDGGYEWRGRSETSHSRFDRDHDRNRHRGYGGSRVRYRDHDYRRYDRPSHYYRSSWSPGWAWSGWGGWRDCD